jgi:hypothetical protein
LLRDPPLATYKEACDGTYSLNDWADFHEAMDVEEEYARRAEEQRKRK